MSRTRPGRTVTLEILRAGPPHNQLLSPLTPYLAVCGEAGATVVNLQWEHAPFERRLEDLRYNEAGEDPARRLALLEEMGREIAQLLGSIPALSGVLSVGSSEGTPEVTHLRIVLSASELGLIPYELSKTPSGLQMPAESWLLLQVQVPICLTRHIRSVPTLASTWPSTARVLFVASDPDELPFTEHRDTLVEAVRPWLNPGQSTPRKSLRGVKCDGDLEVYGDRLTVVSNARLEDVKALCRDTDYTHVHVLAHGGEDDEATYRTFGIGLNGEIVTGTRFASALTTTKDCSTFKPAVVSLASCDSANIGSVIRAGASFAHSLHQAGIPLVVASQFPLSFKGSVTAVRRMYAEIDGLLWGKSHPICMFHDLRRELLVENELHSHDWASVVVYEALPPDLEEQLERFRFRQARAAVKAAERQLENVITEAARGKGKGKKRSLKGEFPTGLSGARERCAQARSTLPEYGPYAMESLGLVGSNFKTSAEVSFQAARLLDLSDTRRAGHLESCLDELEKAYEAYAKAIEGFLVLREEEAQREAPLHWAVVQMISTGTVTGQEINPDYWGLAGRAANAYLQLPGTEERAWACGSLAELALLRLANENLDLKERRKTSEESINKIRALVELFPGRGAFPVVSTERQFRRYVEWWGDKAFVDYQERRDVKRRQDWTTRPDGVLDTAARAVGVLSERM